MADRIAENVATFVVSLIPLGIFFSALACRDTRKDNIKGKLEQCRRDLSKELKNKNREQIKEMKSYNLNKSV